MERTSWHYKHRACCMLQLEKKNTMLLLQGLEEGKNAHRHTSLSIYFSLRFVGTEASKIHKAPVSAQPRCSAAGCLSCPPSLLGSSFGSSCPLLRTARRNFCHPCPLPPAGSRYRVSHAKARQVCRRYFCLRDASHQLLQSTETPQMVILFLSFKFSSSSHGLLRLAQATQKPT